MLRYESPLDAMRDAVVFPLDERMHMLAFKAMKIVPAHFIIHKAIARGDLKPGGSVIETSSGNFAFGMAMVCNRMNSRFIAISDPAIDDSYRRQLEMLGGRVEIVTDKKSCQGYQKARLDRLHEILESEPGSFWCRQYDNEDNSLAYEGIGRQLRDLVGDSVVLVAPVGSGGSSCGLAGALRAAGADCTLVGVDTFNSILFGQPDGPRPLRGLGNTVMPGNLKHAMFDHVHWISAPLADHYTRHLYKTTGHFRGPTTGAAYAVAGSLQAQYPTTPIVFVSPDDGSRYVDTTYASDPPCADYLEIRPVQVRHPRSERAGSDWACMAWNRSEIHAFG
ncbi:pyridoxal-5'-phosphate-dependent protein subunit beta [Paracidovorax avenae]|uniref:pyridoxal-phosphate dependent enzyme n=1 Tax=Paracidovorax avenae TaxID=80867 RepID=UPI0006B37163|nr:pyridoxal-phosphate dependent enzyme [Paracidovorax avenae]AVS62331.1 pyridoxal-5'-phosphate-dependent protein subunit beta [Paracidovorax avenae]